MSVSLLHPRPQLTRQRWIDLNGSWGFAYDDAGVGLDEGWWERADPFTRTITVPFPPESQASGIGDPAYHPVVWYRRTFRVSDEDRRGQLLLHFGAVDYRAEVWVNGCLVARHEGGHTPFAADIGPVLAPGDVDQVVVVRAEDLPLDLTQPGASRTGRSNRTRSGITVRPASGSRSGWSRSRATTSPTCAGPLSSTAGSSVCTSGSTGHHDVRLRCGSASRCTARSWRTTPTPSITVSSGGSSPSPRPNGS